MRISTLSSTFVRAAGLAAGLAASLALPNTRAVAQAPQYMSEFTSYSSVSNFGSDHSVTSGCEVSWEEGPFARTCPVGAFTGHTSGWVSSAGELHAGARLETYFDWADGIATSIVQYSDQLQVVAAPVDLSILRFNLFLHGRFRGDRSRADLFLSGSVDADTEWEWATAAIRTRGADYADGESFIERLSVDVPIVGGIADFGLSLRTDAIFGNGNTCTAVEGDCWGLPLPSPIVTFADFANTAGMESIQALDASGNVVSGYTLRSEKGNRYTLSGGTMDAAPVVTTTPEPASLALVGTGALGLMGVAARRRRRR